MRIALVEVGHGGYKPSVGGFAQVHLAGIGVNHGGELVAGLQILVVDFGCTVHGLQLHGTGLVFGQQPFGGVEPVA